MKIIELDGRHLQRSEDGHHYLSVMLEFPEYYGKNMDALFDLLTEIGTETEIRIFNSDVTDPIIKKVFEDASNENNCLNIILTK